MNNFKSISTTLAILGTGAILTVGCKKDSATEAPGGADAAAEDKAEGSCGGGAEASCGGAEPSADAASEGDADAAEPAAEDESFE